MSLIVLLDAGPLGMVTNPRSSPENEQCKDWLSALVFKGTRVVVPEIADYEVRRELLRADRVAGLARLDALKGLLAYAPITTAVMQRAAAFWAAARKQGRQSAADTSLDADMILAAQAVELSAEGEPLSPPRTSGILLCSRRRSFGGKSCRFKQKKAAPLSRARPNSA